MYYSTKTKTFEFLTDMKGVSQVSVCWANWPASQVVGTILLGLGKMLLLNISVLFVKIASLDDDNVLHGFRLWFNVGAGLIGLTLAIALFLIVWLSLVKKISSDDWEKQHPAAIPVATASFILGSVW